MGRSFVAIKYLFGNLSKKHSPANQSGTRNMADILTFLPIFEKLQLH